MITAAPVPLTVADTSKINAPSVEMAQEQLSFSANHQESAKLAP